MNNKNLYKIAFYQASLNIFFGINRHGSKQLNYNLIRKMRYL